MEINTEKNTLYSLRTSIPTSSRRKHPEIWDKFIKIQRKLPANLKGCSSLVEIKLLLKQNGSLLCTCSACRIQKLFHLFHSSAYFKIYVFNHMMQHILIIFVINYN